MAELTHFDDQGKARMVDVSDKAPSERLAVAAMKQSRRARCPVVHPPCSLRSLLSESVKDERLIVAWEESGGVSLRECLERRPLIAGRRVSVLIGPEGGWTHDEVDAAAEAGGERVHLGRAIMRAETAAVAVVAALRYEGGDL